MNKKAEMKQGLQALLSGGSGASSRTDEEKELALAEERKKGRGRPKKINPGEKRSDGYEKASVIVNSEQWAKVREICYNETIMQKDVLELALSLLIEKYEKKHGKIELGLEREPRDLKSIL